jgi:GntR family transcriptional regulator
MHPQPEPIGVKRRPGVPLHHQIFLVLRDGIAARRYGPGTGLPSEDELARQFGVSRVTLRAAMASLEQSGLVERRQGVGTFVKDGFDTDETPLHASMADVLTHMQDITRRTSAHVVEFGYEPGPEHIRAMFALPAGTLLQRVVRVRRFRESAQPILYLTSYIPESVGRHFTAADLEGGSVYHLLQKAGVGLTSGEQVVSATLADPVVAGWLAIDVGAPLLQIRRMHMARKRRPIWHLEVLASPTLFELHMALTTDELQI